MKKFICILPYVCIALTAATGAFAQTGTIDTSIAAVKSHVENALPPGSRVLVVLTAPEKNIADYTADELSARLVNGKRLTVVERSADVINALNAESSYQLSGEVSDDTIVSIGHKTGAQYLISGSVNGSGNSYHLILKAIEIQSGELAGQWNIRFQSSTTLESLFTNTRPPRTKPEWIDNVTAAARKHGEAGWYYDVGVSNHTATEQLARTRARQHVQQMVAENIASDMSGKIDVTSLSIFESSDTEDAHMRIEAVLTNSIRTRVPSYEPLEWYIEKGNNGGKDYYIAHVLTRFPRQQIIAMSQKLEPETIANTVIRQMKFTAPTAEARQELIDALIEVRDITVETITSGTMGN